MVDNSCILMSILHNYLPFIKLKMQQLCSSKMISPSEELGIYTSYSENVGGQICPSNGLLPLSYNIVHSKNLRSFSSNDASTYRWNPFKEFLLKLWFPF